MIEQITSYTVRGDKIKEIIDVVNDLTDKMNALIGDVARMKREMGNLIDTIFEEGVITIEQKGRLNREFDDGAEIMPLYPSKKKVPLTKEDMKMVDKRDWKEKEGGL